MKPGETSGVIDTEYGYHIIQVEEHQDAHTQTFEEAKPQLLLEAKKQLAAETLHRNMDAAHNETLRNPAQAEIIAKNHLLKFFKVDNAASGAPLPELNTAPELSSAIISSAKGAITDVVNLDQQGKAGFAVVTNVSPARNAEFNEVQADVTQRFTTAEEEHMAQEAAKAAAARAQKGESLEALAKKYGLTVKTAAPFTADGAAEGIGSGTRSRPQSKPMWAT